MEVEKGLFIAGVIATAAFVGIMVLDAGEIIDLPDHWEIEDVCLASHGNDINHYHATLSIIIDGETQNIPTDVGIQDSACPNGMRGIHTHDDTGKLHIETPGVMDASVGAFFNIWGHDFDKDSIMGNEANSDKEVVMYVNGVLNNEYEQYKMSDGDVIEIRFQDK